MEEFYPTPKMNAKQWIANFWYYHKWLFLTILVFCVFALICTVQFFSKEEADLSILYVGGHVISQRECEALSREASARIPDQTGDGVSFVDFKTLYLESDYDRLNAKELEEAREAYRAYHNEIMAGDFCVLLLDSFYYEELSAGGALVHLYSVFEELPDSAADYGLRLGDTELYSCEGFSAFPEDTWVCLKYYPALPDLTLEERIEKDEENLILFRALCGA